MRLNSPSVSFFLHLFLFLVLVFVFCFQSSHASHFRYASYSWKKTQPHNTSSYAIDLEVIQAYRASWPEFANKKVGDVIQPDGKFLWGDELHNTTIYAHHLDLVIDTIDHAQDWLIATVTMHHDYAEPRLYEWKFHDCCRLNDTLDGNIYDDIQILLINLGVGVPTTYSYKTTCLPVIFFQKNVTTSFLLPHNPNDSPLPPTYYITPLLYSGLTTAAPAGLSISTTGMVTWRPTIAGYYAIQVDSLLLRVFVFVLFVLFVLFVFC